MPLPPVPETPVNHLKSIDDQLAALGPIIAGGVGLVDVAYDAVVATYAGGLLQTAVYKSGGATVATLTCTYTAGMLTGVVRT